VNDWKGFHLEHELERPFTVYTVCVKRFDEEEARRTKLRGKISCRRRHTHLRDANPFVHDSNVVTAPS
jgi:hypothetical protein